VKFRGKIETNLELGCERVETEGGAGAGGGFRGGGDWRKSEKKEERRQQKTVKWVDVMKR